MLGSKAWTPHTLTFFFKFFSTVNVKEKKAVLVSESHCEEQNYTHKKINYKEGKVCSLPYKYGLVEDERHAVNTFVSFC